MYIIDMAGTHQCKNNHRRAVLNSYVTVKTIKAYRKNNAQSIISCAREFKWWHTEVCILLCMKIILTKYYCVNTQHEYNIVHAWQSDILFFSIDLWASTTDGWGTEHVFTWDNKIRRRKSGWSPICSDWGQLRRHTPDYRSECIRVCCRWLTAKLSVHGSAENRSKYDH